MTLGNRFKVLSTKLAKLSISFASGATQMVQCHIVPKLSAPVILGMNWLTQLNPKINCSERMIKQTSNNMNVFFEACSLSIMHDHIGQLSLIGLQQLHDLVCITIGKNMCTWIVQCKAHKELNAAEVEKLKSSNGMHLYSDIGSQRVLHDWLLVNALHLTLDMFFDAVEAALHKDSQIAALNICTEKTYILTPIQLLLLEKHVCKCSVCGKNVV